MGATASDMRSHAVTVNVWHGSGTAVDTEVAVASTAGEKEYLGIWASKQDGFVQSSAHPTHAGGQQLRMGNAHYSGSGSETLELQVTDKNTLETASCTVSVSAVAAAAVQQSAVAETTPAIGVVSVSSAASGSTLGLVGTPQCGVKADLPFGVHPLQFELDGSQHLGAVAGNTVSMVVLAGLAYSVSWVVGTQTKSVFLQQLLAYQGFTAFPSVLLYFFVFLYQGTVYASQHLVVYPKTLAHFLGGLAGVIACVAVPVWVGWKIRRSVAWRATYTPESAEGPGVVRLFFLGKGEWVPTERDDRFNSRFMSMLKPYGEETCWFVVFFFLLMFAVGALTVPDTTDFIECGHLRMGMAVLFAVMALFVGWLRPYCRVRDNALYVVLYSVAAVAMVMQGLGYYNEDLDDPKFTLAMNILTVALALVIVKAVADLLCDVYVVWTARRRLLQEALWAKQDASRVSAREIDQQGYLSVFGELSVADTQTKQLPPLPSPPPRGGGMFTEFGLPSETSPQYFDDVGDVESNPSSPVQDVPQSYAHSPLGVSSGPFPTKSLPSEDVVHVTPVRRSAGVSLFNEPPAQPMGLLAFEAGGLGFSLSGPSSVLAPTSPAQEPPPSDASLSGVSLSDNNVGTSTSSKPSWGKGAPLTEDYVSHV